MEAHTAVESWSLGRRLGRRVRTRHAGLPPGPPLPSATQMLLWMRRPIELMRGCRALYGTPFSLRFPKMGPIVVVSDPEANKEIFTGPANVLFAGKANEPLGPIVGPESLLLLDGDRHMRDRRMLMPPFHGERMHRYGEVMRDITERRTSGWRSGSVLPVHPETQAITLDIILRTVFGLDEGAQMDALRSHLVDVTHAFSNPLLMVPQLQIDAGPRSPWGRFVRARAATDALLFSQIRARRDAGADGRDDVLTLMLAARDEEGAPMTDRHVRDELMTLLAAGHETTATGLAWAFHLLATHPNALRRVHDELDEVVGSGPLDPSAQLPFVDAVVKETLRVRPVIQAVGRVLQAPFSLAGFELAPGTMVSPSIYLTHMNPNVWRDPDRFDPERFVDAKVNPYSFFPFGGGVRRCLGLAFALYEMRIVLATVLARFTVRPAPGVRVRTVRRNVTLTPSGGAPVVFTGRRPQR